MYCGQYHAKCPEKSSLQPCCIFDPHDEYDNAFPNKRGSYKVNKIDSVDLHTPYWLLNFDEFQSVFLGEVDLYKNSNGIRILKETIVSLKEREQEKIKATVGEIAKVNINAPLYFSFADELLPTLIRLNKRTIWSSDNEPAIDLSTGDFCPVLAIPTFLETVRWTKFIKIKIIMENSTK